ncbi:MAG: peptide chain release factor N(5)-glutamine methyltransferase [Bacilli bacterium]|jgi:release factor glutamine methyltransferase|nr:peptide chain release factor N(5)-glutamine methyltransferase [Bacilli bacterium]
MKYRKLLEISKKKLKENKIDQNLSDILINDYLKITNIEKLNNIDINKKDIKKYNHALIKLIKNIPIQYIIGNTNFYGYQFKVTKSTLIPRFETEELVEQTIKYIKRYFSYPIKILDIGAGSGNIGITLKKEIPDADVTLVDISKRALNVALYNANQLKAKVKIKQSDIYSNLSKNNKFDIIISNPPYIKEQEEVAEVVLNNEPKRALYGGKDGLKYYKKILRHAALFLKSRSMIALEIGENQSQQILKIVKTNFNTFNYKIKKDLQGRERMLFIFFNIK